jgi:uncharacterized protein with ParB-like and HNH nuclease domain
MEAPKIDAKVSSLREILTELSDIDVPWYQRTYKWADSQVDDIFHDVVFYAWDAGRSGAYLGSIVFAPGEKVGAWEIIDGQQRVTTLTVLLSVLAHSLLDNAPTSSKIGEVFTLLHRKDGSPKLQPKEMDFAIYTEIVSKYRKGILQKYEQGDKNAAAILEQNLLFKAYERVQEMVDGAVSSACRERGIERQQATEQLIYSLLDAVRLVRILAPDNSDGIKIFESLNASGMPLEEDELIKSTFYMHAKVDGYAKDRVQDLWEGKRGSISSMLTTSAKRSRFLRSYWLSNHRFVRKDGLFDAFNQWIIGCVKQAGASKAFKENCAHIERSLHAYSDMEKAASGYEFMKVQNYMGASMFRTVLLAVYDLMHDGADVQRIESIKRVGYILETVLVRMSVAGQTTNVLEKSISDLAIKIRAGEGGLGADMLEAFVRKFFQQQHLGIPSDALFTSAFISSSLEGGKSRKWVPIFYRLNRACKYPNSLAAMFKDNPDFGDWSICSVRAPFEAPSPSHCRDLGFMGVNDYLASLNSPGNFVVETPSGEELPINMKFSQHSADANGISDRNDALAALAVKVWPLW